MAKNKVKAVKSVKVDNAAANRMRRPARTLKAQPNNLQVVQAMKSTRMHRKAPVNPIWSASRIQTAKLFKLFGGRVDIAIFSKSPKEAAMAALKPSLYATTPGAFRKVAEVPKTGMFTLGLRAVM